MSVVTAAEFNRQPSQVKRAAAAEPVVITEHSRPAYVLMSYREYERLTAPAIPAGTNMADWLRMDEDIDFEIPELGLTLEPIEP